MSHVKFESLPHLLALGFSIVGASSGFRQLLLQLLLVVPGFRQLLLHVRQLLRLDHIIAVIAHFNEVSMSVPVTLITNGQVGLQKQDGTCCYHLPLFVHQVFTSSMSPSIVYQMHDVHVRHACNNSPSCLRTQSNETQL